MTIISDLLKLTKQGYTTYDIGLIQARGYRALKQLTAKELEPDGITTMEWAILGILFHHPKGLLASELADQLGVKPPLVSRLIVPIEKTKWISVDRGEDKRERIVQLTTEGRRAVERIEKKMRIAVKPLLKGVSISELMGYLRTLATIAENGKHLPEGKAEDYIPE